MTNIDRDPASGLPIAVCPAGNGDYHRWEALDSAELQIARTAGMTATHGCIACDTLTEAVAPAVE